MSTFFLSYQLNAVDSEALGGDIATRWEELGPLKDCVEQRASPLL
jgi:hypothetical protein